MDAVACPHPFREVLEHFNLCDDAALNGFGWINVGCPLFYRSPGAQLHGELRDCYKIKLRKQGYRLVYSVEEDVLVVLVVAIDKRENMAVYRSAVERLLTGK